jgi:hypothetical protein
MRVGESTFQYCKSMLSRFSMTSFNLLQLGHRKAVAARSNIGSFGETATKQSIPLLPLLRSQASAMAQP